MIRFFLSQMENVAFHFVAATAHSFVNLPSCFNFTRIAYQTHYFPSINISVRKITPSRECTKPGTITIQRWQIWRKKNSRLNKPFPNRLRFLHTQIIHGIWIFAFYKFFGEIYTYKFRPTERHRTRHNISRHLSFNGSFL